MATTKILPRRRRSTKRARGPIAHPPKGLMLADIGEELDCLAELVQVLGVVDHADVGAPLDKSLHWVGESLRRLGHRVLEVKK